MDGLSSFDFRSQELYQAKLKRQRHFRSGIDAAQSAALYSDRRLITISGWVVAIIGLSLFTILQITRELPPEQIMVLAIVIAANFMVAAVLPFVQASSLPITVAIFWSANALNQVLQIAYFYFGPDRLLITQGVVPVLCIVICFQVIWGRTMLKPRHAKWCNGIYLLSFAAIAVSHTYIYWNQTSNHYAMLLMLITIVFVGTLVELLMALHARLLMAANHKLVNKNSLADVTVVNPARDALRLAGVRNSQQTIVGLEESLLRNRQLNVAQVELTNLSSVRRVENIAELRAIVENSKVRLEAALGGGVRVGFFPKARLIVWCDQSDHEFDSAVEDFADSIVGSAKKAGIGMMLQTVTLVADKTYSSRVLLEELAFLGMTKRLGQ